MISAPPTVLVSWSDKELYYYLHPSAAYLADLAEQWLSAKAADPLLTVFNFSPDLLYLMSLHNRSFAWHYLQESIQSFDLRNLSWMSVLLYYQGYLNQLDLSGISLDWPSEPLVLTQLWQAVTIYWHHFEGSEAVITHLRTCFDRHADKPILFDEMVVRIQQMERYSRNTQIHELLQTNAPVAPAINAQVFYLLAGLDLNQAEICYLFQNLAFGYDDVRIDLDRKQLILQTLDPILEHRYDVLAYLAHQIETGGQKGFFKQTAQILLERHAFSAADLKYLYFRARAPLLIIFPEHQTDTPEIQLNEFVSLFRKVPGLAPAMTQVLEARNPFLQNKGAQISQENMRTLASIFSLASREWLWLMLKTESLQHSFTLLGHQENPALHQTIKSMPMSIALSELSDCLDIFRIHPELKNMFLNALATEPLMDVLNSEKKLNTAFTSLEIYLKTWIDQKIELSRPCEPLWIYMNFVHGVEGVVQSIKGRLQPPAPRSLSDQAVKTLKYISATDSLLSHMIMRKIWLHMSGPEQRYVTSISKQLIQSSLEVHGAYPLSETTIPWLYFAGTIEQKERLMIDARSVAYCQPEESSRALRLLRAKTYDPNICDQFGEVIARHPAVVQPQLRERLYSQRLIPIFKRKPELINFGLFDERLAHRITHWVIHSSADEVRAVMLKSLKLDVFDFSIHDTLNEKIIKAVLMLGLRWPSVKAQLLKHCDPEFTPRDLLPITRMISAQYCSSDSTAVPPIFLALAGDTSVQYLHYNAAEMPESLQPIILNEILRHTHLQNVFIVGLPNPSAFFDQWHLAIQDCENAKVKQHLFGLAIAALLEDQGIKDWICKVLEAHVIKARFPTVRGNISLRSDDLTGNTAWILPHLLPELLNNTMLRESIYLLFKNKKLLAKEGIMTIEGPLPFDPKVMLALEASYERERAAEEEKEKNKHVLMFSAHGAQAAGHAPGPMRHRRKSSKKGAPGKVQKARF